MTSQQHYLDRLQEFLERSNECKPLDSKKIDLLLWKFSQIPDDFTVVEDVPKLTSCCLKYVDLVLKYSDTLSLDDLATKACKNRIMGYMGILNDIGNIASIKNSFVENITVPLLERILDPCIKIVCGKELIRNFNSFVQNSDKMIRENIVESSSRIYLYKLADIITSCGDYEYQNLLLETIFRMCMKNTINKYAYEFFPETESLQLCLVKIDVMNFDKSIRIFLNTVNKIYRNVLSIEVKSALLDHVTVAPPMMLDGNREALWIDFNLQSETIGIFCDRRSLNSSLSLDSDTDFDVWELITIFTKDVSRVQLNSIEGDSKRGVSVVLYLTVPCHVLCGTSEQTSNSKQLILSVYDMKTVKLLKNEILPKMFHDNYKGPKCYSAQVITSSEDSYYSAQCLLTKPVYKPLIIQHGKSKTVSSFSDGRSMKSFKSMLLAPTNRTSVGQTSRRSSVSRNRDDYNHVGKFMQTGTLRGNSSLDNETMNSYSTCRAKLTDFNDSNDNDSNHYSRIRQALYADEEIVDLSQSDDESVMKKKKNHIRRALSAHKDDTIQNNKQTVKRNKNFKQTKFRSKSYEKLSTVTLNSTKKSKSLSNLSGQTDFQSKKEMFEELTNTTVNVVSEKTTFHSYNSENSLAKFDSDLLQKSNELDSVLKDFDGNNKLTLNQADGKRDDVILTSLLENVEATQETKTKEKFKVKFPYSKGKKPQRNYSPLNFIAEMNEEHPDCLEVSDKNEAKSSQKIDSIDDGINEKKVHESSLLCIDNYEEHPKVVEKEIHKSHEESEIYQVAKETVSKYFQNDCDISSSKPVEICSEKLLENTSMIVGTDKLNHENKSQEHVTSEVLKKCEEIPDVSLQNLEDVISRTEPRIPEKQQERTSYQKSKRLEKQISVNNEICKAQASEEFDSPIIHFSSERELSGKQSFVQNVLKQAQTMNLPKINIAVPLDKNDENEDILNTDQYAAQIVQYVEHDFVNQDEGDRALDIETIEDQTEKWANEKVLHYKECKDLKDETQLDNTTETNNSKCKSNKGENDKLPEEEELCTKQTGSNRKSKEEIIVKSEEGKVEENKKTPVWDCKLQNEEIEENIALKKNEHGGNVKSVIGKKKAVRGTNMEDLSEGDEINSLVQYSKETSQACDKIKQSQDLQSKIKARGEDDTELSIDLKTMQTNEPLKEITFENIIENVVQDAKDTLKDHSQIKYVKKNRPRINKRQVIQDDDVIDGQVPNSKDIPECCDENKLLKKSRPRTKKLQKHFDPEIVHKRSLKDENIEMVTENVKVSDAQEQDSNGKLLSHDKIKDTKSKKPKTKKRQSDHDTELSGNAEVTQINESLKDNIEVENVEFIDGQDQTIKDRLRHHNSIKPVKKRRSRTKKQRTDHDIDSSNVEEVHNKEPLIGNITEMATDFKDKGGKKRRSKELPSSEDIESSIDLIEGTPEMGGKETHRRTNKSNDDFTTILQVGTFEAHKENEEHTNLKRNKDRNLSYDNMATVQERLSQPDTTLFIKPQQKKLEKVIPSKSITSQKTEISSLTELYIGQTKKHDDSMFYTSSPSDHMVSPRQQDNSINKIINESSQDRDINNEMVQTCTHNSGNNTNAFKPLRCYVNLKRAKLPTLANNSASDSISDMETVEGECVQNYNKSNTLTDSNTRKIKSDRNTESSSNVEDTQNKGRITEMSTENVEVKDACKQDSEDKFQSFDKIKTVKKSRPRNKKWQRDLDTESSNNLDADEELSDNDVMNSEVKNKLKRSDIIKAIKKRRSRKLPNCKDAESSIDLMEGASEMERRETHRRTNTSGGDDVATILQVAAATLESHIINEDQHTKIPKENNQQLVEMCKAFNSDEVSMYENFNLLSNNDILEKSYITHIMHNKSMKTKHNIRKQLYDVETEVVLSQSKKLKKNEDQNQSYNSMTSGVQERLSQSDTTLFVKPQRKGVTKLFNLNNQSHLETINFDVDTVEAKLLEVSRKEDKRGIKVPLERKTQMQRQRKVVKCKMSDSDNDTPKTFVTSAVVHASQAGHTSAVRKVATQQCLQVKKFVDDLDIVQVDDSTQLNEIAFKKPLNLPTSLTTLNKPDEENETRKVEITNVRNVSCERKDFKGMKKSEDGDVIGTGKHKEAIKVMKKIENRSILEKKTEPKRYSRKRKSVETEKKKSKMNTTSSKRKRTTHNSIEDDKKKQEYHLEFSNFMAQFLEDVNLSRAGDYSKADMVLRTSENYDCDYDSDVPLAKNRKRKKSYPSKGKLSLSNESIDDVLGISSRGLLQGMNDKTLKIIGGEKPLLQSKRKKLEKVIPSKIVISQKTEISSLPELCIEKTKKQDDCMVYTSSPSDHMVSPRCQQLHNSINKNINESLQDRNIKNEMVETCTDNTRNNTNAFKPCYINLESSKLPTLTNNSVDNSIFDNKTVEGESMENCMKSNTVTVSNKQKIKILQNILLCPEQRISEANSQASDNGSNKNDEEIAAQMTTQIESWICTGNNQPQLCQRLLEVLLRFFNDIIKIVLEDMKGPIPPHLLAMFETFSELGASLDKHSSTFEMK